MSKKRSVRMKITDFINSDIENDVIAFLGFILKNIKYLNNLKIIFWYTDKELTDKKIKEFKNRNENFFNYIKDSDHEIDIVKMQGNEPSCWYDIINEKDAKKMTKYRIRGEPYTDNDSLIQSLITFNDYIKFPKKRNVVIQYERKK